MARADRQQLRTIEAPAKRGEILDRNGHVLAYSVDADTIVADPSEIENADNGRAAGLRRARRAATPHERQRWRSNLRREAAVRLPRAQGVARRGAARQGARPARASAFLKESRRYYPKKELASHVLGYVGARQHRPGRARVDLRRRSPRPRRQGPRPDRCAPARALRAASSAPPTAGASLELTIDQYLQHIAERELRAGVEQNRRRRRHGAHHGAAHRRDPRAGELADVQPERLRPRRRRGTPQPRHPGSLRAGLDVQDRDGVGRARRRRASITTDLIDCAPGHIAFGSRVIDEYAPTTTACCPFKDVIVKSSNVGAIKVGLRLGAGAARPLRQPLRLRAGARTRLPRREPRHRLESRATRSERARVGLDGVSGRRHAAADGGRGQLGRQRRLAARAARRARVHQGRPARAGRPQGPAPHDLGRTPRPSSPTIMEGVVERGTAKAAQIEGYTIAGKTGTAAKLVERPLLEVGLQRVVRRVPAVAQAGPDDPRRHRLAARQVGYYGGAVAAPIFKRIAEASLRHLGIAPTINAPPPVLVARHDVEAAPVGAAAGARRPASSTPRSRRRSRADAGPARTERARSGAHARPASACSARMVGDGFVLEQSPDPGAPLDRRRHRRPEAWTAPAAGDRGRRRRSDAGRAAARRSPIAAWRGRARRSTPRSDALNVSGGDLRLATGATGIGVRRAARPAGRRDGVRARRHRQAARSRSSREAPAPADAHAAWMPVPDARLALAVAGGRRSTAIRANGCCSSASPAPTARRRRRICSPRSSRPRA